MMFLVINLALAADFGPGDMPCAKEGAPALSVDTKTVRWPWKARAARIVIEAQRLADSHAEECTRLLTLAADSHEKNVTVLDVAHVAVAAGRTVSMDTIRGQVATDVAAEYREVPVGYGYGTVAGYGGQGAINLRNAMNLGFVAGQQGSSAIVAGRTETATDDASTRQRAVAEAERARAAAKRATEAASLQDAGGS